MSGSGGCLEPHTSKHDFVVFLCMVAYKLRLRVSRYSWLAIYPATPNVNMYKQGGPDVPPYRFHAVWCCQVIWSPGRSVTSHDFFDNTWQGHGNYPTADKCIWCIFYYHHYLLTSSYSLIWPSAFIQASKITDVFTSLQVMIDKYMPQLPQGCSEKSKDWRVCLGIGALGIHVSLHHLDIYSSSFFIDKSFLCHTVISSTFWSLGCRVECHSLGSLALEGGRWCMSIRLKADDYLPKSLPILWFMACACMMSLYLLPSLFSLSHTLPHPPLSQLV